MSQFSRQKSMTYQELDVIFPFFVLAYGAIMTFVLNNSWLMNLARERFPAQLVQQMSGHRILAVISLVVGGLWSLQQIWLS